MIEALTVATIIVGCLAGYGLIGTVIGALTLRNQRGKNPVTGKWDDPLFTSALWGALWPAWIAALIVMLIALPFFRLYIIIGERISKPKSKKSENVIQTEKAMSVVPTYPEDEKQYVPIMVYETPNKNK